MKIRISSWNERVMSTVIEKRVNTLEEIISEIKWMNDNDIHGAFDFISENEADELFLEAVKRRSK